MTLPSSNFYFLKQHDEQLVRLGRLAERYFPEDPNTCLLKLRQLAELLAQLTATQVGSYVSADEKQFELLQRLEVKALKYFKWRNSTVDRPIQLQSRVRYLH